MNIVIERASVNDAQRLIEVQNESFQEDYSLYGECPAYNESEETMIEHIKNCMVYKIIMDDEIVGDMIIRKRDNNNYYLRVLAILPEYQSCGIGSQAIKYLEKDNPDALEWELITPFKSYRNHHFYEKWGYKKIGEKIHSDVLILWQYKKRMPFRS